MWRRTMVVVVVAVLVGLICAVDGTFGLDIEVWRDRSVSPFVKVMEGGRSFGCGGGDGERHRIGRNVTCGERCVVRVSEEEVRLWREWIVAGLGVQWWVEGVRKTRRRLGSLNADGEVLLNNHVEFVVRYKGGGGVVDSSVTVWSTNAVEGCTSSKPLQVVAGSIVRFTYSVKWEEVDDNADDADVNFPRTKSTRNDDVLRQIAWLSMLKSITSVGLVLLVVMTFLLIRNHLPVHVDDVTHDDPPHIIETIQDTTKWNKATDVFRPPPFAEYLAILYGSGIHIAIITFPLLLTTFTNTFYTWTFTSIVAGYASAAFYHTLDASTPRRNFVTIGTWWIFPGVAFAVILPLNGVLRMKASVGVVDTNDAVMALIVWSVISLPLSFLGATFAYRFHRCVTEKSPPLPPPLSSTSLPLRRRPSHGINPSTAFLLLGNSFLPFGIIYVEFYYTLKSLWHEVTFPLDGFVVVAFVLLFVSCSEVSIVTTYVTLRDGSDIRWWGWRAFFSSAISAVYAFVFSVYFLLTTITSPPHLLATQTWVFLSYMFVLCTGLGITCGFFGLNSAFYFTRWIYNATHVD